MNLPFSMNRREIDRVLHDVHWLAERDAPRVGNSLRFAYIALGIFVLIFGLWAVLAPLQSAAIASGTLRAEGGGRKTVQHLEGGIIRKILVREGQKVRAGQPLVLLDDTQSQAREAAMRTSYYALLAQDARLTAELSGAGAVAYPQELLDKRADPEVRSVIAASDAVFRTRKRALGDQISVLNQRLGQANADMAGARSQVAALGDQNSLLSEEMRSVSALVNEGLERKSRLLALQRQQAATVGQQGQLTGSLGRIRDTIGETTAQMSLIRGQQATETAAQQREVQVSLADARERLAVSRDIKQRQQIVAPVDGTVMNLRLVTPGGVVGAGQPLLDIVPNKEKIIVSARLKAYDIDVVHNDLRAEVKLTPYKARVLPLLHGVVRDVSPDATLDEATSTLYYKVEIEIDGSELRDLKDVRLVSGMPAEVFISLGSRSLFQYLFQPLFDSFHRAFREQ
ncbi:HlyD family type I secretion periplasmic adaptor subunit [Sphingobium lactosutens]|uniref:HlyD family type I secretion periplasmic adaptor subunit n=1 Tax=Sphingobium lactosutens TaxID=522773 RepID=UPI0015BC4D4D|nr:HlyD family type I secretion periplasmic adaptor subunit [Sphingobium lactosutens]NWK95994.1 HlyD family type I secretion periplasmic adaptor subunit [Sphingobium lactosutens]